MPPFLIIMHWFDIPNLEIDEFLCEVEVDQLFGVIRRLHIELVPLAPGDLGF